MAGLLATTAHPLPSLSPVSFHSWYDNSLGPSRLRLRNIISGIRFRATDLVHASKEDPEWLALYDIDDVDSLIKDPAYQDLQAQEIQDKSFMAKIVADRAIYRLDHEDRGKSFVPLESLNNDEARGASLVAVQLVVKPNRVSDVVRWYNEYLLPAFSGTPGWRRSRLFSRHAGRNGLGKATGNPDSDSVVFLILADLAHKSLPRFTISFHDTRLRTFEWYYTLGPAPRDLSSLAAITPQQQKDQERQLGSKAWSWTSDDKRTRTFLHPVRPVVESYITTPDGVDISYRLEGGSGKNISFTTGSSYHPLLLLSNPILADWSIWDKFVDHFLQTHPRWRVLRYLTRGRGPLPSTKHQVHISVDLLASDVKSLLDALRVPKAALLVGVSLGAITVLNFSSLYPSRVAKFVAADTTPSAAPSNRQAWAERISLAEKDVSGQSTSGDRTVGKELGSATARRWLVPETYSKHPELAHSIERIVAANSLEGLRSLAHSLYDYDIRARLAKASVSGLFVVGAQDGPLPKEMKQVALEYGSKREDGKKEVAQLKVIDGAGHLPNVEQPEAFFKVVNEFVG